MGMYNQLKVLMCRNFILRYRREPLLVLELGLPLLLGLVYLMLMSHAKKTIKFVQTFDPTSHHFLKVDNTSHILLTYAPKSSVADDLMSFVNFSINVTQESIRGFDSVQAYLEQVTDPHGLPLIAFVGINKQTMEVPKQLYFQLLDQNHSHHFESVIHTFSMEKDAFHSAAVVRAQIVMSETFINYWRWRRAQLQPVQLNISTQIMPFSTEVTKALLLSRIISCVIIVSLVPVSINIIKIMVSEREMHVQEFVEMLEVSNMLYWLSWYLVSVLGYILVQVIIFLTASLGQTFIVVPYTSPFIIILLLALYAVNSLSFCLLTSNVIMTEVLGTCVVNTAAGIALYLFAYESMPWMSTAVKLVLGVTVFQVAFCQCVNTIITKEYRVEGYTFSNIFEAPSETDEVSLLTGLLLVLGNTWFNLAWMCYFTKLQPTYYADSYSHLFCFKKSFWVNSDLEKMEVRDPDTQKNKFMEPDPKDYTPGIEIQNLAKFSQNEIIVADTTINILDNQITVILGPQGRDKPALIGMITGLARPTRGTVFVNGFDVTSNRRQARENIGLCPKYDILFSKLTSMEHLTFCYQLKGMEVEVGDVTDLLADIELTEKANTRTVELTPYERKLLSVASATIGDPKVVVLDEPSKDLEIGEQREIWSFLKTLRPQRTIVVVTTNLMEAEVLADRLAIMIEGDMKCYGSQMFLKKKYGVGYQLIVAKKPGCLAAAVTAIIARNVSSVSLLDESSKELCYHVPYDAVSKLSRLLHNLDQQEIILNIGSLSLYTTTMNEVFTKVQHGFDPKARAKGSNGSSADSSRDLDLQTTTDKRHSQNKAPARIRSSRAITEYITETVNRNYSAVTDNITGTVNRNYSAVTDNITGTVNRNYSAVTDNITGTVNREPVVVAENNEKVEHRQPASSTKTSSTVDRSIYRTVPSKSSVSSINQTSASQDSNLDMSTLRDDKGEYAFRRRYSLPANRVLNMKKIQAIMMTKISLFRRGWMVALIQTGIPPVLLLVGLVLDIQSSNSQDSSSVWYSLGKMWSTTVLVFTSNYSDVDLVNCYKNLVPANHIVKIVELNESIKTAEEYLTELLKRFGGNRYMIKFPVGVDFSRSSFTGGIALYNLKSDYGAAISTQMLLNAHVQNLLGNDFYVHSGQLYALDEILLGKIVCPATTLGLTIGLVIFSVVCVHSLISERQRQWKSLLEINGVTPSVYWLSSCIGNMSLYSVVVIFIMVIFRLNEVVFLSAGRWKIILFFLYLFELAFLPHLYLLQKFFRVPADGVLLILLLQVAVAVSGSFILLNWKFTTDVVSQRMVLMVINIVLEVLSPVYSLSSVILIFPVHVENRSSSRSRSFRDAISQIIMKEFDMSLQRPVIILICQSMVYWVLVIMGDTRIHSQLWHNRPDQVENLPSSLELKESEDDDVIMTKHRVDTKLLGRRAVQDILLVHKLEKRYTMKIAVHETSLVIENRDCFGLLGPTGSGKSTLLYMLVGKNPPTGGNVYFQGLNVQQNLSQVQSFMTFTPQYNILNPRLTGRETLHFFGRLRGVPDHYLYKEAAYLMRLLTLQPLADLTVFKYSASKKRLLSVAISLLGQPVLMLLDEPSYGLDSIEKKVLWSMMKRAKSFGTAILFTTKSVEECEAVCTNMAIQIDGQIKCLGSPRHLKKKFAIGYTIHLYLPPGDEKQPLYEHRLLAHMMKSFPGTEISEKDDEHICFRVPESNEKLFQIFKKLNFTKRQFKLRTFILHETTLEQVYLSFAKGHLTKPVRFVPKKKTVRWAANVKETVNTIPNKYSAYQNTPDRVVPDTF